MSDIYESPLVTRYASKEMASLFSMQKRIETWRRLWLELARVEHALGLAPDGIEVALRPEGAGASILGAGSARRNVDGPLDGLDDLLDGGRLGVDGKPHAAVGAARALDDASTNQVMLNGARKGVRHLVLLGGRADGDNPSVTPDEFREHAERIIRLS